MKSRKNSLVVSESEYNAKFNELLNALIWPSKGLRQRPIHMAAINPTPSQLESLVKLFPNSKFVGLVRNGIEVVSSRMEFNSFADKQFESHCDVWSRSEEVVRWGRKRKDVLRLIRHEWLYAPVKLNSWMVEFCDWLGIEFSELPQQKILGKLEHPTSAAITLNRHSFPESTVADKRNYFLSKRERWRAWSPEQVAMFEDRCGRSMQRLNYSIPWNQFDDEIQAAG